MNIEEKTMLETSEERVKMLKAGFSQKQMEQLYIQGNNFIIVNLPLLFEQDEIIELHNKPVYINNITAGEYSKLIYNEMTNLFNMSKIAEY